MCVHGSQAVSCTTELCLSVDKLKEKTQGRNDVPVQKQCCSEHSVNCQTESTYTPARLVALVQKLSVVIIPQPKLLRKRLFAIHFS